MLRERTHERARLLYAAQYIDRAGRPHSRGTQVALIHGYGGVARGPSRYSPIDGTIVMGSDTVTAAFRAAIDNDRIKAILFRVDSPGGSYVASDTIWRETMRAREAGKPVVVSMGNLAGSGGYFVAMAADRIVAQPGTITASIGVYGGKMLTTEFWEKLGISYEGVASNPGARHWSPHFDYDAAGNERLDASLDRIYQDFTEKVAEGRGLTRAAHCAKAQQPGSECSSCRLVGLRRRGKSQNEPDRVCLLRGPVRFNRLRPRSSRA